MLDAMLGAFERKGVSLGGIGKLRSWIGGSRDSCRPPWADIAAPRDCVRKGNEKFTYRMMLVVRKQEFPNINAKRQIPKSQHSLIASSSSKPLSHVTHVAVT